MLLGSVTEMEQFLEGKPLQILNCYMHSGYSIPRLLEEIDQERAHLPQEIPLPGQDRARRILQSVSLLILISPFLNNSDRVPNCRMFSDLKAREDIPLQNKLRVVQDELVSIHLFLNHG